MWINRICVNIFIATISNTYSKVLDESIPKKEEPPEEAPKLEEAKTNPPQEQNTQLVGFALKNISQSLTQLVRNRNTLTNCKEQIQQDYSKYVNAIKRGIWALEQVIK
jgi:hypothetical protein